MSVSLKSNSDGSAAVQVGGVDRVILPATGGMEVRVNPTENFVLKNMDGDVLVTMSGAAPAGALTVMADGSLKVNGKNVLYQDVTWNDL